MFRSLFHPAPLRRFAILAGSDVHVVGLNVCDRPAIFQPLPLIQASPFAAGFQHDARSQRAVAYRAAVMPERLLRCGAGVFYWLEGVAHTEQIWQRKHD
ncbi:hypothetical protein MUU49_02040 [Scandinavium goeteborgense]|nr:hypothetical protein [Scandinavium goeteborgense]MCS2151362.1 hypothetical protein [Scandinavium goeteborgense]